MGEVRKSLMSAKMPDGQERQEMRSPAGKDVQPSLFEGSYRVPVKYTAPKHAAARTTEYMYHQLIPYIGNKRKLLPLIAEAIRQTGLEVGTFLDAFAGSGVVSRLAKTLGFAVISNDFVNT